LLVIVVCLPSCVVNLQASVSYLPSMAWDTNIGDSRKEIIGHSATNALLPNLDSTPTVGLVTLPGAFVGVPLSTGSAAQAVHQSASGLWSDRPRQHTRSNDGRSELCER
jgi:hypothetical protein